MWLQNGCLLAVLLSASALCQQAGNQLAAQSLATLSMVGETAINGQPSASIQLPTRCDKDGSYYLRFFHGGRATQEPIYKFDKNGMQKTVFAINSDPEFGGSRASGGDFALGKNGDLYQIAYAETGNYIVRFGTEGRMKLKIRIAEPVTPLRFAVFDSGSLLISGLDRETKANLNPHSIYTGIFDENGNLLRKLVLLEDKAFEEAANRGDSEFIEPGQIGGGNYAIQRGNITRASDGNIYIVRWTTPTRVYAIGPAGDVIRSFEVKSEPERKKPGGVHEDHGRIAIQFGADSDNPMSLIKVVGLDGKEYATYDSRGFGVAFACYSEPAHFTFFKADEKNLKLNFLEPAAR